MCGRYQFTLNSSNTGPRRLFALIKQAYPDYEIPNGEVVPSQLVPVLVPGDEKARVALMVWGYPAPGGSGLVINARRETAGEKPMFRDSLRFRRCVIPTTGYYEWSRDGAQRQKYYLYQAGTSLQYLAGLYDQFEGQARFVILTAQANASVADIHPRMPLILRQDQVLTWLNGGEQAGQFLTQALADLLREPAA